MRVCKTFEWEAAHKLKLPYESKCKNIHGHSYLIEVEVEGDINKDGMVIDFSNLRSVVEAASFDHKFLNDVIDKNPTAENLVLYLKDFLDSLWDKKVHIRRIRIYETSTSFAEEVWK